MNILVLSCNDKYKYHKRLVADIEEAIVTYNPDATVKQYNLVASVPGHEHYAHIASVKPDVMITLDFAGFDIKTSGDTLGYNGFSFRVVNILFQKLYKYSDEMKLRQNMSMITCIPHEAEISDVLKDGNIPNVLRLCELDYMAEDDRVRADNRLRLVEWLSDSSILEANIRPECVDTRCVFSNPQAKRILIFEWGTGSLTHEDVRQAFEEEGYECHVVSYQFTDVNKDDYFRDGFTAEISGNTYEFVYSTNYFPLVAECCNETGIVYVSWSYDAPLDVPNIERTLGLSTNRVFLYDRLQVKEYRDKGYDRVYHLPLAVNTNRLDRIVPSGGNVNSYSADIAFVGQLYKSELDYIKSELDEYNRGFIDAIVKAQSKIYGYYLIDDVLNETNMRRINSHKIEVSKEALSYAMAAQITRDERLLILKLLSNHYDVSLYSSENNPLLDKVRFMGTVGYYKEMPIVFKTSRINLNISLKCIKSGIPLRCLDIMGAGGLLLSNYQPELAEHFVADEEIVMYDSVEDMYEKVRFLLNNEDVIRKIAVNGYNRVKSDFTYESRIREMLRAI